MSKPFKVGDKVIISDGSFFDGGRENVHIIEKIIFHQIKLEGLDFGFYPYELQHDPISLFNNKLMDIIDGET